MVDKKVVEPIAPQVPYWSNWRRERDILESSLELRRSMGSNPCEFSLFCCGMSIALVRVYPIEVSKY